jgi:FMN phosphatase YigB (HAD superfamily)
VVLSQPLIAHDLNEVRRIALHELAAPFPEEQQYVDDATEVFFNVRSDVSDNLYSDSIECLEWFHNLGVEVGVLTNGSADLTKSVALNNLLSLKLTAGEVGCSKPSPVGFMACAQVRNNAVADHQRDSLQGPSSLLHKLTFRGVLL